MTDLTTRPVEAGPPDSVPASTPANGAVVADIRTLRHVSRAEQERLSADAEVERRARAARLDFELREQRRAAARREREAEAAQKRARAERRRARRTALRARLRAAVPLWAERALFVLPIMFPMAVAWVGQIRFAMTVMGWPLAAAVVFAAGFELSTAYVARLDWLSRAAGDSALLFRGATWVIATGAATMNYWHAAGPGFAPTGEAVSYGLMSVTGVVLWELLSIYRHRTALRAEGKLPSARPRFGLARWIWFRPLTRLAWLLALRDGYTTTDLAWRAALAAVDLYGSAKAARKAVRSGRPVPPLNDDERDDADETDDHRDTGPGEEQRDIQPHPEDRDSTDPDLERDNPERDAQREDQTGHHDRDYAERDTPADQHPDSTTRAGHAVKTGSGEPTTEPDVQAQPDTASVHEPSTGQAGSSPADYDETNLAAPAGGDEPRTRRSRGRQDSGEQAVSAKMLAYARERLAQGATITGAELDRQFGTCDYGRKVLRRLAAESQAVGV